MKYCSNCGRELNDSAMFCPNCGGLALNNEVAAMEDIGYIKGRNIALCIIFTILTCGIYGLYWMVKLNDEVLKLAREDGQKGIVVLFFTIITCGLYGYYWAYKMGNCVEEIKESNNTNTGIIYMILLAVGLGIANYALIQDSVNSKVNNVR